MKKRITLAAVAAATVAALLGTAPEAVQARSLEEIRKSGTLRLATEGYFPPFAFFEGQQLTGFEVELAQMLVAKMGLKHEWKTIAFDALLTGLQQDRWDLVISSHGITEERQKAVNFAQPHYCSGALVVARDSSITKAADLKGKSVAVQTGTTYQDYVQNSVPGVGRVVNFPTNEAAISALMTRRVDAFVTERFLAAEMAAKNPNVKIHQGDLLYVERLAPAVAKNNQALADAWNAAFAQALADGSYAQLSQKWFKEDVRCPAE